ncbi:uncharacterized protein A1O9_06841 [Exophiala aquamarina CBS 119918]|uniref:Uncharacterized protein n=1 Tax=Exophiala aquamarina CBS 119918 TaxID=1182545 RepID=A0A072PA67_9EURO|nr:uncharacterized protein A1O9_06841 [Exophiala aquamarina CBS 119918]KEF56652.1 hypothetical protein A1O9_06841 [Exophiala aquamarina CBS 119918]
MSRRGKVWSSRLNFSRSSLRTTTSKFASDLAIGDDLSAFYTTTNDYSGEREGNRVAALGEKP